MSYLVSIYPTRGNAYGFVHISIVTAKIAEDRAST